MAKIGNTAKLSVATLAIMNVTAVVSLRGLPAEAEYGVSSAFYYLFAALVFLIPTALVAAELAAMFSNKQGGVFRWVGEAFGNMAAMGREYYLVSHGAHFWRCFVGLYWYGWRSRHGIGLQSHLYTCGCVAHLLDSHIYLTQRYVVGGASVEDRRIGGNDHSGRIVGGAGHYLSDDGRQVANGFWR